MAVRFEPAARRAVDAAMREAEARGHAVLDPAHLLLGLLDNPNATAAAALELIGVQVSDLRAAASAALRELPAPHPSTIDIDDATEEILQRAADLAAEHGDAAVSDVDVLVACAERGATRAGRVLAAAGAGADEVATVAPLVRETAAARAQLRGAPTPATATRPPAPDGRPPALAAAPSSAGATAVVPLETRVGTGYDSHRFAEGGPMVLGGVKIPVDYHLAGHSDGDAIAHAVTDAVLGAAGLGDIGEMFADTDPANEGRDSMEMLRSAVARLAGAGWRVQQVDATLVAERPKVLPHRAAMREALARALGVDAARVSVKGKTNEGMGWIGRGEGVACMAVATVVRPLGARGD
jgi:2-C-methyl-D-erythritol 2,4-cyclodiphosphate synthase